MKTKLIVNPVSARGKMARRWPQIEQILHDERFPFEAVFTERRGQAVELTRRALEAGFRLIVAVGGDGTLHEVVNGMLTLDGEPLVPEAAVGVIPSGTGSDFVRTAGLPHDAIAAARHLAHAAGTVPLDVGAMTFCVDGKEGRAFFANVAGLGFDAEVVERTERKGKHGGGTIPYLTTLISTISMYQNKDVSLRVDEQRIEGRMNSVIICNGQYFGGGMRVGPNATFDDALLDVIVIGDMNAGQVLANTPKIYDGTHLTHPKVSQYRGRTITVEPAQRMMLQADGELMGQGPATFRVLPHALRLWM